MRSGSALNARVCLSGLGVSTAYVAGRPICRARAPSQARARRRGSQWTGNGLLLPHEGHQ
eukprot:1791970-Alexandrium_andersonii.AAC.1